MKSGIDAIVNLLIAIILIYAGFVVLETINTLLAVLFVILGIYLIWRTISSK